MDNNSPQFLVAYYLIVLWIRNLGTAYLGPLPQGTQQKCSQNAIQGQVLTWRNDREKFYFHTYMIIDKAQLLKGCRSEGLKRVLVPCWLCHMGFSNIISCFTKVCKSRKQGRESASQMAVTIMCNLITEEISHHCYHSLLVKRSHRSCPHAREIYHTTAWIPRGRNHWMTSENLPTTFPAVYFICNGQRESFKHKLGHVLTLFQTSSCVLFNS